MILNEHFLKYLVERKGKENDLSDILYALFNSNDFFNSKFIDLINNKAAEYNLPIEPIKSIIFAEREVDYEDNGRPDIVLNIGRDKKVLLEVKINDTDYHEIKYNKILSDKSYNICFIILLTKFSLGKNICTEWIKITWADIVSILEYASESDLLLNGIKKYFRRALDMNEIKEVYFNEKSISSLLYFNRMLLKSIQSLKNEVLQANRYSTPVEDDGLGYYFEIELKKGVSIYPWYGLNFNEEHRIGIMIWVQKHSHKKYFPKIVEYLKSKKLSTDEMGPTGLYHISKKEDDIVYMMNEVEFKETFTSDGIVEKEKQQNKLNEFLLGFVKIIKNALEVSE